MRVLHVYRTYFPDSQGGLEEAIRQICISTRALGVETRVLSLTRDHARPIVRPEAEVYRAKLTTEIASNGISIEAISMYAELARWADVIHYHFPWPFADVLRRLTPVNRPSIVTYHSDIVRQKLLGAIYKPLMYRFLGSVDTVVCTSPNYLETSSILAKFRSKVQIIPFGLNEDSYPTPSPETLSHSCRRFGSDYFLFIGVLRYYKGLQFLLDALKGAPYRAVIAGSGPVERDLRRQASKSNLGNVTFAGQVTDEEKVAMFQFARGLILPSHLRSEAFGITLLEGAMFGKPLISAEVGSGTSYVNQDGVSGFVVEAASAPALRRTMDHLHAQPEVARRMGLAARERFERHFSASLMGERYYCAYQKLLEMRQGSISPAKTITSEESSVR